MLQRVRELAVQYNNGTLSATGQGRDHQPRSPSSAPRSARIASRHRRSTASPLLDRPAPITFQVGADDGETISVSAVAASSASAPAFKHRLRLFDVAATTGRSASIDDAIAGRRRRPRPSFGSVQNRLEHTLNNLATYQENLTASESRIRDVDMAAEMVNFTKLQILQQAGTSMLAQANQPRSACSRCCAASPRPDRTSHEPSSPHREAGGSCISGRTAGRPLSESCSCPLPWAACSPAS